MNNEKNLGCLGYIRMYSSPSYIGILMGQYQVSMILGFILLVIFYGMGEVNQVVFVSEMLSQCRSRGLDLDRLAQHKALQDGHTLEKKEAIQYLAKCLGDQMQKWYPIVHPDSTSQHKIAELEAKIASLEAAAHQNPTNPEATPTGGPAPSVPTRSPGPLEAAFQGHRPPKAVTHLLSL